MRNRKEKLVRGVGVNDAEYITHQYARVFSENSYKQKLVWRCPFYVRWTGMLERCYGDHKLRINNRSYSGCFVCTEWLFFSNFKAWMEKQDWEGKQLDKDILYPGNLEYGPEKCVFVSHAVNSFVTEKTAGRGKYLIGVYWNPDRQKFYSSCNNRTGKPKHLGCFDTELEAHKAWLAFKLEQAKILAAEQSDPRVAKALIERYENYVIEE